jgi:hypothetical protein
MDDVAILNMKENLTDFTRLNHLEPNPCSAVTFAQLRHLSPPIFYAMPMHRDCTD